MSAGADVKETAGNIFVIAISPQDFGMMNGKKVLDGLLKRT